MIMVIKTGIRIKADPKKVIAKYLYIKDEDRIRRIISDVLLRDESAVENAVQGLMEEFENRHIGFKEFLLDNYNRVESHIPSPEALSFSQRLLLGSYFTHEYSVESAALFNPSIVVHPDQKGVKEDEVRFILSLRATGEEHISSIVFMSGIISQMGKISLDPRPSKLACPQISFGTKDYSISFDGETALGSRVIFPVSAAESGGMEDVRFVEFSDGGNIKYVGTYTAYDGKKIRPVIIETEDFISFRIHTLVGHAATGKGMALFPEKIEGQYAMIGRQGGENISIMYSTDLYCWDTYKIIQRPERDWELTQLGNCGSPLKTPSGWLLLTHAVGPMRKYVISASLLDLHKPEKVLATLDQPLIYAEENEREGYVPNVVYTCGIMQHFNNLIIPYAMSDSSVSFARVDISTLINILLKK
ncbi:MAG: glycoside hydrolase family 130 protein [Bacteroides sp.]|nr:glycoside hydrolase family 130 protein [Bacteroides sp.]